MDKTYVNIACGTSYVDGWINFDYAPVSPVVIKADLLGRLLLNDASVDVLYSSHFLEHIPRKRVKEFFAECFRVLKPAGQIRFVLPDLQEICREYLHQRDAGEHAKADFVVLEMLDQCVRTVSGGELGGYYKNLNQGRSEGDMATYIANRTGEEVLRTPTITPRLSAPHSLSVLSRLSMMLRLRELFYCRAVTWFLPSAFREQNISFAQVGERHAWIYDFYELSRLLEQAGFISIRKMSFNQTGIEGFPLSPLDINEEGHPRKGLESMYVEARKP